MEASFLPTAPNNRLVPRSINTDGPIDAAQTRPNIDVRPPIHEHPPSPITHHTFLTEHPELGYRQVSWQLISCTPRSFFPIFKPERRATMGDREKKKRDERNLKILQELLQQPGNDKCADCGERGEQCGCSDAVRYLFC